MTLGALALVTASQATADARTVRLAGGEQFKPNEEAASTFR